MDAFTKLALSMDMVASMLGEPYGNPYKIEGRFVSNICNGCANEKLGCDTICEVFPRKKPSSVKEMNYCSSKIVKKNAK